MRSFLIFALAFLPAVSLAQRGGGGRGGGGFSGGGSFNHGGGNAPNTFVTIASTAPAAATSAAASTASTSAGATNGGTSGASGSVQASQIPPYGITAGVKANDGTANCVGDNGKAIPCSCPPSVNSMVTAVQQQVAGGASFPSGNSAADQLARLNICIVALQNVNGGPGSGVGCPVVSTTWLELRTQLQSEA